MFNSTDERCILSRQETIGEIETETTTEVAKEDARGLPGIEIQDAVSLT